MSFERVQTLQQHLIDHHLDALLVFDPANRRYLSGFSGSTALLLLLTDASYLVTDGRYSVQAAREAPSWQVVTRAAQETLLDCVGRYVAKKQRIGFDPHHLSFADYVTLTGLLDSSQQLVPTAGLVERLRAVKDAQEIALLRTAVRQTDQALAQVRPLLQPERSEREVAWLIHQALVEAGAAGPAFEIIVAAGPNSALPHARPSDDLLGSGRPIIIDMGALHAGYHGDMTRTFILGTPDPQWWQIYNLTLSALQTASAAIQAGTSGQQADALARDVIAAAGYGDAFGHGLGHGVGLQIHEQPRLNATNPEPLPVGAVFSIEPGIYIPDWGGVRLENLALLHDSGVEILTTSPLDNPVLA